MALGRVVESGAELPRRVGAEGELTEGVSFLRGRWSRGHAAEAPLDAL
jgi:hypothetical protein